MVEKILIAGFSIFCYLVAMAALALLLLFLQGYLPGQWLRQPANSMAEAAMINVSLIVIWALQHTGMASSSFKRWSSRFVLLPLERSLYCLLTAIALIAIVFFWIPVPRTVYNIESAPFVLAVNGLFWAVWGLFLVSLMLDSFFEFFGLKQAYCYILGRPFTMSSYKTHHFHRYVRHPSLSLMIIGFWITPRMTVGHLMLASLMTLYTVLGAWSVDRKFVRYYGKAYIARQHEVPLLVPRLPRRTGSTGRVPGSS